MSGQGTLHLRAGRVYVGAIEIAGGLVTVVDGCQRVRSGERVWHEDPVTRTWPISQIVRIDWDAAPTAQGQAA
jgi:hypothetical protein